MAETYSLQSLGVILQEAALAINHRAKDETLEYKEVKALSYQAQELLIKSKTLFELATIEIGVKAQDSLAELNTAQKDIVKTLKTIKSVQKAINIAGKLVSLSGALLSSDVAGVVSSVKGILTDVADDKAS
ncbi:MAG: hypothetical protein V4635_09125 [Bacteroidota bacterium]